MKASEFFNALWERVPAFFKHGKTHRKAAAEVIVVNVLSLLPLLAVPITALRETNELDFGLLSKAVGAGQLFLYGFALFGTLFWLCIDDDERLKQVRRPFKMFYLFLTVVPALLAGWLFATDTEMTKQLSPTIIKISEFFYFSYVVLYYILLVINKMPLPDVREGIESEVDRLTLEYNRGRSKP